MTAPPTLKVLPNEEVYCVNILSTEALGALLIAYPGDAQVRQDPR